MQEGFELLRAALVVAFVLCCGYQYLYMFLPLLLRDKSHACPAGDNRIAVLIAARNEARVLPRLLDSIRAQDYPAERLSVFVVADNCTDDTALTARAAGATVYERFNAQEIGKGYALRFLIERIWQDCGESAFDAYLVLDADNLLRSDYITRMNETFSQGEDAVTGFRNTKNYGDSWVSAGSGLSLMREAALLNHPRALLGLSASATGPGTMYSARLLRRFGGWPFVMLTEDIETTAVLIASGLCVGYCPDAVLYDEQPVRLSQSVHQRMRWVKGYLQVFSRYGGALVRGAVRGVSGGTWRQRLSCLDFLLSYSGILVLTIAGFLLSGAQTVWSFCQGQTLSAVFLPVLRSLAGVYAAVFVVGLFSTLLLWRRIRAGVRQKLRGVLTFPLFIVTYMPIALAALFMPVGWTSIEHSVAISVEQLENDQEKLKD